MTPPKPYDGPVILPTGVPVDPNDPTKGTIRTVASAAELTEGVTELYQASNHLHQHLNVLGAAMQDGFADIGGLLEALIRDIAHEVRDDGADVSWLSDDVQEFLIARADARAEAAAARAATGVGNDA